MIKIFCALALAAMVAPAYAAKSCDELKTEIEAKIKGHGVASFTLDVVPTSAVKDQKVVGSCEGGSKNLVYKKS